LSLNTFYFPSLFILIALSIFVCVTRCWFFIFIYFKQKLFSFWVDVVERGSIALDRVQDTRLVVVDGKKTAAKGRVLFEVVTEGRVYVMAARDERSAREWVDAIRDARAQLKASASPPSLSPPLSPTSSSTSSSLSSPSSATKSSRFGRLRRKSASQGRDMSTSGAAPGAFAIPHSSGTALRFLSFGVKKPVD
jgi:hypothetical protein